MIEEEQDPSDEYIKAFNTGYQMRKHEPELLDKILKNDNKQSENYKALKFGKEQQEREQLLEQMKKPEDKENSKQR